jgi:hypothetical protein
MKSGNKPDGLFLAARGIGPCTGGFSGLRNPLKFLPYFGGPAVDVARAPTATGADRQWATLVAQ